MWFGGCGVGREGEGGEDLLSKSPHTAVRINASVPKLYCAVNRSVFGGEKDYFKLLYQGREAHTQRQVPRSSESRHRIPPSGVPTKHTKERKYSASHSNVHCDLHMSERELENHKRRRIIIIIIITR